MIFLLATFYILDMLALVVAGGYGFFCAITSPVQYVNPLLSGRRAKIAVWVPFLWLYHVSANAQTVYAYLQAVRWEVPSWVLIDLTIRQGIGFIGTIITGLLMAGCKFGEK